MRSARYRKLIQGLQREQPEQPFEATLSPTLTAHCQLQPLFVKQLQSLCQQPHVFQLLARFLESMELPEEVLGKKSAQITVSKDQSLCLKSISQEDLTTFQKLFQAYCEHVQAQQSLLIPILGAVLLVTLHEKHNWSDPFIIMPNLQLRGRVFFDIKGYADNRAVPTTDFQDFGFGKDENFIKSPQRKMLRKASSEVKERLLDSLEKDLLFLRANKIIDYSLALVFGKKGQEGGGNLRWVELNEEDVASFYIIDYLQVYNERKKLENKVKSLFYKQISSVDPDTYAQRLLSFIKKCLL